MYPKVRFKLNKQLDIEVAIAFLGFSQGGVNFSQGIIDVHLELEDVKSVKKEGRTRMIKEHFNSFYGKQAKYLAQKVVEFNKKWQDVEKSYFNEVAKIFKGEDWPKGKYIGYVSIIDCNPRFLKDKTFQVFYRHPDGMKYVTAHELLHFIFYDYTIRKHFDLFKKRSTEKGIYWDLAEIFNAIILGLPQFVAIHNKKSSYCYPEHRKYYEDLKKIWEKEEDVDKWIIKSLGLLLERPELIKKNGKKK